MPDESSTSTFGTVSKIIELLDPLSEADRVHVLTTIATWYKIGGPLQQVGPEIRTAMNNPVAAHNAVVAPRPSEDEKFSDRAVVSPKDFIFEKDPLTEVERLACLAYYLTHYLETPHFKTIDLSRLNTEAAQRKLSNPAVAASNAMRDGFFVHSPKEGSKQLSAMGERFVQSLPNREAAQKVKQRMSSRRGKRNSGTRSDASETNGGDDVSEN